MHKRAGLVSVVGTYPGLVRRCVEWSGVEDEHDVVVRICGLISTAGGKTKHVRTNKLGEVRQIRDVNVDVVGILEVCGARGLNYALLSYRTLCCPIL